jgi:hypothetical protein
MSDGPTAAELHTDIVPRQSREGASVHISEAEFDNVRDWEAIRQHYWLESRPLANESVYTWVTDGVEIQMEFRPRKNAGHCGDIWINGAVDLVRDLIVDLHKCGLIVEVDGERANFSAESDSGRRVGEYDELQHSWGHL